MLLAVLVQAGIAQQRPPVFAEPAAPARAPKFKDPNPERLTADQQRCANLGQELLRVEERVRQAKTTGEQNPFAAKRQQVIEQRTRAGC